MLGNILGDTVGSVYEFANIYTLDFPFLGSHNAPTDDTVCTVAVADWLIHGGDPATVMRQWCMGYPNANYGPLFRQWLESDKEPAYGSWGNGAPMRIGASALWFKTPRDAYLAADEMTNISHNHAESIHAARAVVAMQRHAWAGVSRSRLIQVAKTFYGDAVLQSVSTLRGRQGPHFDPGAKGTMVQALVCVLASGSVEEAIRNCVSIGGDCDTSACIAGGIAEAMFGFPDEWLAPLMERIPKDMRRIIVQWYAQRACSPIVLDPQLETVPFYFD